MISLYISRLLILEISYIFGDEQEKEGRNNNLKHKSASS